MDSVLITPNALVPSIKDEMETERLSLLPAVTQSSKDVEWL